MSYERVEIGQTRNNLRIDDVLGFDSWGLPTFGCYCTVCKTRGLRVSYFDFRKGAQCPSPYHGREEYSSRGTSLAYTGTVEETRSARSQMEYAEFMRSQQPVSIQPIRDPEMERREALRRAENQRWAEQQKRIAEQHRTYARHAALEWSVPLEKIISLQIWRQIGDSDRERIMDRIRGEKRHDA